MEELKSDSKVFEDWKKRTKEDWKDIAGKAVGIDIYNYLNPRKEGNCVLTTGNEMAVDIHLSCSKTIITGTP